MGGGVSMPVTPPDFGPEYGTQLKAEDAPHFVTKITDKRPVVYAEKGCGSAEESPSTTLLQMFRGIIDKGKGDLVALRQERPVPPLNADKTAPPPLAPEQLTTWTYKQYFDQSMALGAGCIGAGFVRHDCVLIFGFNSPEWLFSAMAGICAGGPFTGIYPTDTPEQVTWKAKLTNASVAFVEDESAEEKILSSIEDIPYLKAIVCWNHDCASGRSSAKRTDGSEVKRLTMEELKDLGKGHEDSVQERLKNDLPTDCCDLIFTSGTTGNPKAVMVSNDNVAFMGRSLIRPMTQYMDTSVSQRSLSYLPLSHIAGSLSDIFMPIVATYDFDEKAAGWELTFARPYDLKAGSLKDRLLLTRPTVFMGVPRVWEKIHEKMLAIGAKVKGTKRKVANWAKGKALKFAEEQQIGGSGKIPFGYPTAKKLILNKIKNALGLDQVVMGLTGAAPMKLETLKYFGSIGIQINEVYGMSETTGVCTLGTPSSHLWGSCGFPLPGVEVEIFQVDPDDPNKKKKCPRTKNLFKPQPEEEGEICFRGRNIMLGYMSNPALGEEHMKEIYDKNAAALDNEGAQLESFRAQTYWTALLRRLFPA
ncbi:Long-chain-fatty-acid--CoA ligase ACSBG2 (Acyl-CoA synthetase bubblegum family member 2) (Arachidonate--CoA ligase ACSBG2) [Durusdinium trenchii]|uniref:Long-chain-fatty-acid--CoA ligase ACSBG2 (Acyl-CoA synthetase bubblegum family member 2) (Arachidonate--CoA ligase ACSBG2) n=1 Tax=Durusdinium trenchii TaxID=1381693 RepID=A0ABP0SK76_9DINO